MFSGFETQPETGLMQEEVLSAVQDGVASWDNGAEEPNREYNNMFGDCKMICDYTNGEFKIDYDAMGAAGRRFAGEPVESN